MPNKNAAGIPDTTYLADTGAASTACRTGFDAVCESLNIHPNKKITDGPKVKDLKFD